MNQQTDQLLSSSSFSSFSAATDEANLKWEATLATAMPADVEHLTSVPVCQWGYADVADFFRATLSLPLDLSRETANFIEEQGLDGALLTKMSELDLRRSGVNTQWCHRIVTTLELVKERQHRRRLQLLEDNDMSLAAYIENQFTQQLALLHQTVQGQQKVECALNEHTDRGHAMAKRIARLEYALEHRKLQTCESTAENSAESMLADKQPASKADAIPVPTDRDIGGIERLFAGTKHR